MHKPKPTPEQMAQALAALDARDREPAALRPIGNLAVALRLAQAAIGELDELADTEASDAPVAPGSDPDGDLSWHDLTCHLRALYYQFWHFGVVLDCNFGAAVRRALAEVGLDDEDDDEDDSEISSQRSAIRKRRGLGRPLISDL